MITLLDFERLSEAIINGRTSLSLNEVWRQFGKTVEKIRRATPAMRLRGIVNDYLYGHVTDDPRYGTLRYGLALLVQRRFTDNDLLDQKDLVDVGYPVRVDVLRHGISQNISTVLVRSPRLLPYLVLTVPKWHITLFRASRVVLNIKGVALLTGVSVFAIILTAVFGVTGLELLVKIVEAFLVEAVFAILGIPLKHLIESKYEEREFPSQGR